MKRLILILVCLIVITPSQAEEKKIGQTEPIQHPLRIQEERLKNIEEQALKERQRIENWYKRQLTELRQWIERKAKHLKLDDRALWVEFMNMYDQTQLFDSYFKRSTTVFTRNIESYELHAALVESYFLSAAAGLLVDKEFHNLLTKLADGSAYNPHSLPIRHQARKLLHFVNEFQSKVTALQERKAAKLDAVEQTKQRRRAEVLRLTREIKTVPGKINEGVVSAIIYSRNSPLCMIDGFEKVLNEGDSIGSIVIVKIYPDQVEFAKGGQKWTQRVGKPAHTAWK